MTMEEEVDGLLMEKRSMTNYTKKSKQIGNSHLQHSTRSFLNFISCDEKKNRAEEMDVRKIAWSRLRNEHTDALTSLMTQTQMMMIKAQFTT